MQRLTQIKDLLAGKSQDPNNLPWDPESTSFPSRKDLPRAPGNPEDAAWVWGKDDYRGRLNLLTPSRIKAASAEIRTGETARLDLKLHVPDPPAFGRETFQHTIKTLTPGVAYDDIYHLNTQSGTQWDGFRHFAHIPTQTFYNNTRGNDFDGETDNHKCSIHHWSASGFCGRGVLLDFRSYADAHDIQYDSATQFEITYADLEACGKHQGIDIRPASQGGDIQIGDILVIRTGWTQDYYKRTRDQNAAIAHRKSADNFFVGVKQDQTIIDWLHDCYFAAVGGDAPTFEVWPTKQKYHLHEYILALWGMPLGEMLDLEKASEIARKNKRYFFFFTSAPANCLGGVSTHVNGTAIF